MNSAGENERVPKPARIPPHVTDIFLLENSATPPRPPKADSGLAKLQVFASHPPAGGKSAEAGRIIHSPRQIVSPCRVRISNFNHLDFARNSFELCPTNTAFASPKLRVAQQRRALPTFFSSATA
jgi:hypothetical protein